MNSEAIRYFHFPAVFPILAPVAEALGFRPPPNTETIDVTYLFNVRRWIWQPSLAAAAFLSSRRWRPRASGQVTTRAARPFGPAQGQPGICGPALPSAQPNPSAQATRSVAWQEGDRNIRNPTDARRGEGRAMSRPADLGATTSSPAHLAAVTM